MDISIFVFILLACLVCGDKLENSLLQFPKDAGLLHRRPHKPPSGAYQLPQLLIGDIARIVKYESQANRGNGAYSYGYESSNGISASEYGVYERDVSGENGVQRVKGSYSYTGPDNVLYSITYTAGPEGFVPIGAHIPKTETNLQPIQHRGENNLNKYTGAVSSPYKSSFPKGNVNDFPNYAGEYS